MKTTSPELKDTITQLSDGEAWILVSVDDPLLASRLTAMGVLPGHRVSIVRKTIGGNTCLIKAGKHFFAMRRNEVNALTLRPEAKA